MWRHTDNLIDVGQVLDHELTACRVEEALSVRLRQIDEIVDIDLITEVIDI